MAGNFGSQTGNNVNNSNGKFSSQTNSSTTPTRTQRIFYKQQGEKQKQEQQQAEMLGSSLWKDVEYKVPEQYVIDYRPKQYSQEQWNRFSERSRMLIMRDYSHMGVEYYARRGSLVPNTYGTREVTRTREFTNTDYAKFVDSLSPEMKKYFISVPELEKRQQDFRSEQKTKTQTEITNAQQKLKQEEERYRKKIANKEEWWHNQSSKYRDDPKNKQRYMDSLNDYENRLYEEQAYYKNYLEKLNFGVSELDKGKMFDYNAIQSYAKEYGNYKQNIEHARNNEYTYNQSQMRAGLTPIYSQAGTVKGWITPDQKTNLPTYLQGKITSGKYGSGIKESDVKCYQGIVDWTKKVGFSKVSNIAQKVINPSAIDWQTKNPTEKLVFDSSGNVQGVESGAFQMSLSTDAYDKKVSQTKLDYQKNIDLEEQRKKEAEKIVGTSSLSTFENPSNVDVNKDKSFLSNAWDYIKAGYFASPFGAGYNAVSEENQQEATKIREKRVAEAFNVEINPFSVTPISIPAYKFFTLPFSKSLEIIKEENQLTEEQKKYSEKLRELELVSRGGGSLLSNEEVAELKPYVMQSGLELLKEKGLEVTETTTTTPSLDLTKFGKGVTEEKTETTIEITDPAFDRRLSQNILEWEQTRQWDENTVLDKVKKDFALFNLGTRIVSSKVLENYLVWKGGNIAIKGVISGTKSVIDASRYTIEGANLIGYTPKVARTMQVTLQEGYAVVPYQLPSWVSKAVGVGVAGLWTYGQVKKFESYGKTSEYGKEVFALELLGELGGIEMATGIGKKTYSQIKTNIDNWNIRTIKEADLSQKGFYRLNKYLGAEEKIYMTRAKPFKLSDRSTWNIRGVSEKLQGYKAGQFTGQVKKIVSDEVMAFYKYGGDVKVYNTKGELIKDITATPFPYDDPATHYDWITRKNLLEYGTGKYKELRIDVRKYKGFVYTATGEKWDPNAIFQPDVLYDKNGNVIAYLKGALRYGSGKGVSEGFLRVGRSTEEGASAGKEAFSPTIYAQYLKDIKINKAIKEVKGTTGETGIEDFKMYLYGKDTGALGTGNIPLNKREVETTFEFEKALTLRTPFAIRRGLWKIPVVEQVVGGVGELELLKVTNGITNAVTEAGVSSLPSRTSNLKNIIFSYAGFSRPSKARSYSFSSAVSSSAVSSMSNLSKVSSSSVSKSSNVSSSSSSFESRVSAISSRISSSTISSIISGSSTSSIRSYKSIRLSPIELSLLSGKIRKLRKKKKVAELKGLLPDFTSRAIGLKPQQFGSVKDALREINKIKTGFEVQRGGRIVNEKIKTKIKRSKIKNLGNMDVSLKGIMA